MLGGQEFKSNLWEAFKKAVESEDIEALDKLYSQAKQLPASESILDTASPKEIVDFKKIILNIENLKVLSYLVLKFGIPLTTEFLGKSFFGHQSALGKVSLLEFIKQFSNVCTNLTPKMPHYQAIKKTLDELSPHFPGNKDAITDAIRNLHEKFVQAWVKSDFPMYANCNPLVTAVTLNHTGMLQHLLNADPRVVTELIEEEDDEGHGLGYFILTNSAVACYRLLMQAKNINKKVKTSVLTSLWADFQQGEQLPYHFFYSLQDGGFDEVFTPKIFGYQIKFGGDPIRDLKTFIQLLKDKKVRRIPFNTYGEWAQNVRHEPNTRQHEYESLLREFFQLQLNALRKTIIIDPTLLPHIEKPTLADVKASGYYEEKVLNENGFYTLNLILNVEKIYLGEIQRLRENTPPDEISFDLDVAKDIILLHHCGQFDRLNTKEKQKLLDIAMLSGNTLLLDILITAYQLAKNPHINIVILPLVNIKAMLLKLVDLHARGFLEDNYIEQTSIRINKMFCMSGYAKRLEEYFSVKPFMSKLDKNKLNLSIALADAIKSGNKESVLNVAKFYLNHASSVIILIQTCPELRDAIVSCRDEAILTSLLVLLKLSLSENTLGVNLFTHACKTNNIGMLRFIDRATKYRSCMYADENMHICRTLASVDPVVHYTQPVKSIKIDKHVVHSDLVKIINDNITRTQKDVIRELQGRYTIAKCLEAVAFTSYGQINQMPVETPSPPANSIRKKKNTLRANAALIQAQANPVPTVPGSSQQVNANPTSGIQEKLTELSQWEPCITHDPLETPFNNKLVLNCEDKHSKVIRKIRQTHLELKKIKKPLPEHNFEAKKNILSYTIHGSSEEIIQVLGVIILQYKRNNYQDGMLLVNADTSGCTNMSASHKDNWIKVIASAFGFAADLNITVATTEKGYIIFELTIPEINTIWRVRSPEQHHADVTPVYINANSIEVMCSKLRNHLVPDNRAIVSKVDNRITVQPNLETFAIPVNVFKQLKEIQEIRDTWERACSDAFCVEQVQGVWQMVDGREIFKFAVPAAYEAKNKVFQMMVDKFLGLCKRAKIELAFTDQMVILKPEKLDRLTYPKADHERLMQLKVEHAQAALAKHKEACTATIQVPHVSIPKLPERLQKEDVCALFTWLVNDILPVVNFNFLWVDPKSKENKKFYNLHLRPGCFSVQLRYQKVQVNTLELICMLVNSINQVICKAYGFDNKNKIPIKCHYNSTTAQLERISLNHACIGANQLTAENLIAIKNEFNHNYAEANVVPEYLVNIENIFNDICLEQGAASTSASKVLAANQAPIESAQPVMSPIFSRQKMTNIEYEDICLHLEKMMQYNTQGKYESDADFAHHALYVMHAERLFENLAMIVEYNYGLDQAKRMYIWRDIFRHAYNEIDVVKQLPVVHEFVCALQVAMQAAVVPLQGMQFRLFAASVPETDRLPYQLKLDQHIVQKLNLVLFSFVSEHNLRELGHTTRPMRLDHVERSKRYAEKLIQAPGDLALEQLMAYLFRIGSEAKNFSLNVTSIANRIAHTEEKYENLGKKARVPFQEVMRTQFEENEEYVLKLFNNKSVSARPRRKA